MTREQILELKAIEARIAELKNQADVIKNEIKKEMGAKEQATVDEFKIHWTVVISTKLDGSKLKKEDPELWNKYSKEDITRRFSIT